MIETLLPDHVHVSAGKLNTTNSPLSIKSSASIAKALGEAARVIIEAITQDYHTFYFSTITMGAYDSLSLCIGVLLIVS